MSWESNKSLWMSAAGEDGVSNEPSEYSEAISLRCAIYLYHCKSHIRELAVCSVAGAVADVALICLPSLPTLSSKSAVFVLASHSSSRTTALCSRRPFLESPGSSAVVKRQRNWMSRLKYSLFPLWQLIKQALIFLQADLVRGCHLERSLPEKTTYFIFRKSAMCLGMRGVLKVAMATAKWWPLLSRAHVWLVLEKGNGAAALLHPSLITLNHSLEMSDGGDGGPACRLGLMRVRSHCPLHELEPAAQVCQATAAAAGESYPSAAHSLVAWRDRHLKDVSWEQTPPIEGCNVATICHSSKFLFIIHIYWLNSKPKVVLFFNKSSKIF